MNEARKEGLVCCNRKRQESSAIKQSTCIASPLIYVETLDPVPGLSHSPISIIMPYIQTCPSVPIISFQVLSHHPGLTALVYDSGDYATFSQANTFLRTGEISQSHRKRVVVGRLIESFGEFVQFRQPGSFKPTS